MRSQSEPVGVSYVVGWKESALTDLAAGEGLEDLVAEGGEEADAGGPFEIGGLLDGGVAHEDAVRDVEGGELGGEVLEEGGGGVGGAGLDDGDVDVGGAEVGEGGEEGGGPGGEDGGVVEEHGADEEFFCARSVGGRRAEDGAYRRGRSPLGAAYPGRGGGRGGSGCPPGIPDCVGRRHRGARWCCRRRRARTTTRSAPTNGAAGERLPRSRALGVARR